MNLTLYELAEERVALDAILDMDDGEVLPETEALAEALAGQLALKADAFGGYVRELEAIASACKTEEERLCARRKAVDARAAWLKRVALHALQVMGRPRVDGTLFTLAIQNNPFAVQVDVLPDALPFEFIRVVPESRAIDRVALGAALKAGRIVPGCALTQSQSLRIR